MTHSLDLGAGLFSTQPSAIDRALAQTDKIAVLAEGMGVDEAVIRGAIRNSDDVARRVLEAPDTDLRKLAALFRLYELGELSRWRRYPE